MTKMEESCRKLTVAIHQSDVQDCVTNETLNEVFVKCDTSGIQAAYHWIRLLLSDPESNSKLGNLCITSDPMSSVNLRFYTNDNRSKLFGDLASGRTDLYPFNIMVNEGAMKKYYLTSPLTITKYNFYVNDLMRTELDIRSSPVTFLTSPFAYSTWICILICALIATVIRTYLPKIRREYFPYFKELATERVIFVLILTPLITFTAPYCSSLKALVVQPSITQPFSTLFQLSQLIKSHEMRVLLENPYSHRYVILKNRNFNRTPGMQSIYESINKTDGSLVITRNMSAVCELMSADPGKHVFFGYDELIFTSCQRMCIWTYDVQEDVDRIFSFLVNNRSRILTRMADVFSHAIPHFRSLEIERKYKAFCPKKLTANGAYIDLASLRIAFAFLAIGWSVSIVIVICERKWNASAYCNGVIS